MSETYVGWVDKHESRIIVPSSSMKFIIREKDGTFSLACEGGIKDANVKDLQVFKSLEDAHAWMTH